MCTPPHKLGEISMMTTDIEAFNQAEGGDCAFTSPFNVSGNPTMSVPLTGHQKDFLWGCSS